MIRRLQQFRDDVRAVAAVEFALILPLLLTLYLGTIEAATLYSADHKVATVASTMADLVSRAKGEISTTDLDKYFEAAETIMHPYTTAGLEQVVSLLSIDDEGAATVKWSRGHSAETGVEAGREVDSSFPLEADAKINELARGASGWLVASEITYPHQPLFGLVIPSTITLRHTQYFLPRFNGEIELD
jgi:Flp pilus assembly protein TadG